MTKRGIDQHPPSGRRSVRVAVLVCLVMATLPVAMTRADSGQTSDHVASEILRVQAKADAAAQRWSELDTETTTLADQMATGQSALERTTAAFQTTQAALASIAVNRFMGGGISAIGLLGADPVPELQKEALVNVAIGAGAVNLDDFEAQQKSLNKQQADLASLQQRNDNAKAQLTKSQADLNDQLTQLAALETNLKDAEVKRAYDAQLAAQRAKQQAAADKAAARTAAAAAPSAAAANSANVSPTNSTNTSTTNSTQSANSANAGNKPTSPATQNAVVTPIVGSGANSTPTTSKPAAQTGSPANTPPAVTAPPPTTPPAHPAAVIVGGSWLCPVAGPKAFGHTFGDPRPNGRIHEGVDMMSPLGTPLVAVVAGYAQFKTNTLGGNTIGLQGADGNSYYYAHLSSWEGQSRAVQAGDVIGYVGHTGDSPANHLHFEIHPGGGDAVDPYDTLSAHC